MRRKTTVLIVLFLTPFILKAQDQLFKSLFIYNFTKNIEWPTEYRQGNFVIGILGNSPVQEELNKIASRKKIGNQNIAIKKYNSVGQIDKCHIIYISEPKSGNLPSILDKTHSQATLVITDKPGLAAKGASINFVKVDGKQKFEINRTNIEKSMLKVNTYLVSLGIEVK